MIRRILQETFLTVYLTLSPFLDQFLDTKKEIKTEIMSQFLESEDFETIINFLTDFQNAVMTDLATIPTYNIEEHYSKIKNLYEHEWNSLSEKFFKHEFWPSVEILEEYGFEMDNVFRILYKELYYRHIYVKVGSTKPKDKEHELGSMSYERFKSWQNYVDFFNLIINTESVPEWTLPSTWLWDIMDEFIYQFSQFRTFRSKLQSKQPEEIKFLEENELWGIHSVLNVLYSIVEKSCIIKSLRAAGLVAAGKDEEESDDEYNDFADSEMYKYLGYFSLIGLLKFHVLTGDHQLAIGERVCVLCWQIFLATFGVLIERF